MKDRFLTLDAGAGKILLCEFARKGSAAPVLVNYALALRDSLSAESANASLVSLSGDICAMMRERGIAPAPLYMMLPGQAVFSRFVKVPGGAADITAKLVADEAAEGLPFPLDQVIWDYQVIGEDPATGEQDILIVATKRETANDAAELAKTCDLPPELIAASPLPLANAVRMARGVEDDCTLVLDIGARTTDLVFLEGEKVFIRTIPVAGNTITNEISRQLGIEPAEAEELKKNIGFVALGGTYAVTDDEQADKVSKIIRNVITRLHMEVSRSIAFYRSQQGGSAPARILFTGGSAQLSHLDTFFKEKFGVEIEYFNPFSVIEASDAATPSSEEAFLMAGTAGLASRATKTCPFEGNLIPEAVVADRKFRARLPFFALAAGGLIASLFFWFLHESDLSVNYGAQSDRVAAKSKELDKVQSSIGAKTAEYNDTVLKERYLEVMALSRYSYANVIEAVRDALLTGTWVESMTFKNAKAGALPLSAGNENDSESDDHGTLELVIAGFKQELGEYKKPASEMLLERLLKSPFFKAGEDSKIDSVLSEHGGRISKVKFTLRLTHALGCPDAAFLPAEKPVVPETENDETEPEPADEPAAPVEAEDGEDL